MPLDLPDGYRCFVDANILDYHFVDTPPLSDPCTTFLTIEPVVMVPVVKSASSSKKSTCKEESGPDAADPPDSPNPPTRNRH
jgi:hypothetical protein